MHVRFALALMLLTGCAYPQRQTHLIPAPAARITPKDRPTHMVALTVLRADLPTHKRAGISWDKDGSGPDPFFRLYVNERLLWESPVMQDTHTPEWNASLPFNLTFPPQSQLRIEILDKDGPLPPEPMGEVRKIDLPPGQTAPSPVRWLVDGQEGVLLVQVAHPHAHTGVGVTVEIHHDALHVLQVVARSPAARAGIQVGTRITAIDGRAVGEMSEEEAFSRLSLASDQRSTLTLQDPQGAGQTVTLDNKPLWLTM